MKKKVFLSMMVLILTMGLMVGCNESDGGKNQSNEFLGKFSGTAGTLEFLPDKQVKVDLEGDAVWMISNEDNNHKTYTYKFITKRNDVVEYDEAAAINYYKPDQDSFFMQNFIQVEKDKVILYPERHDAAVFNKVVQ
ncbi:MAG: hypothetical protein ACRKFN_13690 [Desulfitobacterium sp.]